MDLETRQPGPSGPPPGWRRVQDLAARQAGVVSRAQLGELGLSSHGIAHRISRGRLHRVFRGVYAVGRPQLDADGRRSAALLACGRGATLSHSSGEALWRFGPDEARPEVTLCPPRTVEIAGILAHRSRTLSAGEVARVRGLAVTDPLRTLVDLAPRRGAAWVDDAVERISQLDLATPEQLSRALAARRPIPGSGVVREVLERWTVTLTDTQLERRLVAIARRAGLGTPRTQAWLNGSRVDLFWPELGLVVEADSLRYHRTAARQAADAARDQRHAAAGLTPIRFSHAQITREPATVESVLRSVAARLRSRPREG